MELTFNQDANGKWVAEFEATGDFNLHIEREKNATMYIYQRGSTSGEYAFTTDTRAAIFDADFTAMVYPKYIKVVSYESVSNAVVTFNA